MSLKQFHFCMFIFSLLPNILIQSWLLQNSFVYCCYFLRNKNDFARYCKLQLLRISVFCLYMYIMQMTNYSRNCLLRFICNMLMQALCCPPVRKYFLLVFAWWQHRINLITVLKCIYLTSSCSNRIVFKCHSTDSTFGITALKYLSQCLLLWLSLFLWGGCTA